MNAHMDLPALSMAGAHERRKRERRLSGERGLVSSTPYSIKSVLE